MIKDRSKRKTSGSRAYTPVANFEEEKSKIKRPEELKEKHPYKYYFQQTLEYVQNNLNLIFLVLFMISVYYYIESLRGCFDSQAECLKNLNEGEVRELLGFMNKSALILALTITGVLYRRINKLFLVLVTIVFGYLCLYYDVGADLDYHGAYNRAFLLVLYILWLVVINVLIFTIQGLRKFPKITIILLLVFFASLWSIYRFRVVTSCKDWKLGLKGVKLSQKRMPCRISIPSECWIDVLDGLFDYSGWLNDNCSVIRNGDRELYDKYLMAKNPNYVPTNLIGFPRTENYTYHNSMHFTLDYKILDSLIDMNNPNVSEKIKRKTEVMIDYRGEESKVIIRIFRDEDLIKNRLPLFDRRGRSLLAKNLMIIYIDALSRRHFMRKMKKTAAWLEKFYRSDHPKYTSYQFLKYHSTGYFTQINTIPAFLGKWWLEAGGNYYTKFYKEKGAITGQSISFCGREVINFDENRYENFNWEPYDHEHVALFCDPNYNQADNPYTPFLGPYSIRRRCLHGKDVHDYMLEYGYKFWETYKDMPKVWRMDFIDAHEGTMEVVKYLDDKLAKYLTDLEENDLLDDTVLLFMADHGNNMPGFVSLVDPMDIKIEKYLPMMYLVVPNRLKEKFGDNLSHNEQSIVTPWDIHNFLLHVGGAPLNAYNPYGTSFLNKIPNERFNCRKFLIRDDFCFCRNEN